MASKVDFPHPDGPEIEIYSPLRTCSSMPANACVSTSSVLKTLVTLVRLINVVASESTPSPSQASGFTQRSALIDVRCEKGLGSQKISCWGWGYKSYGHLRAAPSTGESSPHFRFRCEFAGIRLPQPLANVIHLPAVNVEIRVNRLMNDPI